jgi:(2Fe-2S) ferredoxin
MSKWKDSKDCQFLLEGRFLGFLLEDGYKVKYLRLATAEGEQMVKLSKESRASLGTTLTAGEWVQVSGYQDISEKKGTVKLKAHQVIRIAPAGHQTEALPASSIAAAHLTAAKSKPCILVCQKSDCCKRGGRAIFEMVQTTLVERNLSDQFNLRSTGCMKRCEAGPNLVMPDKTRHSRIRPEAIPSLIDQYMKQYLDQEIKSDPEPSVAIASAQSSLPFNHCNSLD